MYHFVRLKFVAVQKQPIFAVQNFRIMKAKNLFSLLAVLFLSASIYANTPETVTFSNVEKTESGCVKEFIFCDKSTSTPLTKTVYRYDAEERMQEKATYEWNDSKGWIGIQKYDYVYDDNNRPTARLTKWNNKTNDWI